jgi:4'-phosphopantetheinyl transferase
VDTDRLSSVALPAGVPSRVRMWRLDVEGAALCVDGLTPAEVERSRFYRHEADRVRFAATRLALRTLLGRQLGLAPADVPLTLAAHGKPVLASGALQFNVSHAGRYALIAMSECGPVGVDIERIDPSTPEMWSCTEAALKAWGCGIQDALPLIHDGGQLQASLAGYPPARLWRLAAPPGYMAALALV